MNFKMVRDIITTVVSVVIKILVAVWLVNFIYTKAVEAYDFGYRVFTEPAMSLAPGRDVTVAITEGKSDKAIAETLYDKGLTRDANLAYLQILASEYREKITPGVYELNTSMTMEDIIKTLAGNHEEETEEEE
ncbi:MAG: endolytic transglycosylase MltG [Lachnospiraceae bacterium]|nr:endolytic transglycosylase MltG [Lachnospiraceae bacterium]